MLGQDYDVQQLEVGYDTGEDRLCLWLPMIGRHVINESSPLAAWVNPTGFTADADSHIVVMVSMCTIMCAPAARTLQ